MVELEVPWYVANISPPFQWLHTPCCSIYSSITLFVVDRVGAVSSNASGVAIQCLPKNIVDFEFHLEHYWTLQLSLVWSNVDGSIVYLFRHVSIRWFIQHVWCVGQWWSRFGRGGWLCVALVLWFKEIHVALNFVALIETYFIQKKRIGRDIALSRIHTHTHIPAST